MFFENLSSIVSSDSFEGFLQHENTLIENRALSEV